MQNKKPMKIVFYNCLFGDGRFPETNDKIIYSYLIYKSLVTIDGVFQNEESTFDFNVVTEFWEDNAYSGMCRISAYKIAKDLGMSVNTIKSRMLVLRKMGIVKWDDEYIYVAYLNNIKTSYYFELLLDTGLKGEKLIVYSYLKNKSKDYNNIISTFDKKQAQEFGLSKKHYQKILCELYKDGLIERLNNGKLKIN